MAAPAAMEALENDADPGFGGMNTGSGPSISGGSGGGGGGGAAGGGTGGGGGGGGGGGRRRRGRCLRFPRLLGNLLWLRPVEMAEAVDAARPAASAEPAARGGNGGLGGAGGGALEILARGRLDVAGDFFARGGRPEFGATGEAGQVVSNACVGT